MPGSAKDRFDQLRRETRRKRRLEIYRRGLRRVAIAAWNITKEHNVGSLVRTAHAAAVREVLLVGERDWNIPAAKTSERFTDIHFIKDENALIDHVRDAGYQLVAVELDPRAVSLFDAEYPENPCFLLGAERLGIPPVLLDTATMIVQIPQWGLLPCLNLAVAGSIVLYDYLSKEAGKGKLDRPSGGLVGE